MTKATHTPGPWFVVDEANAAEPAICSDDGIYVASAHVGMKSWETVSEANARLIAAAPDLLEALEELEGYIDGVIEDGCPKCGGDCSEANPPVSFCPIQQANKDLLKARAAIARAKGKA